MITVTLIILLLIALLLSNRVINFLTLLKSQFKIYNVKEVAPKEVDQKILIKLAKFEKILYKKGFTRRVIIELDKSYPKNHSIEYKFYYYNLIEGIHAYIIYQNGNFYYYFETLYNSQNSVITSQFELYIKSAIPDYVNLHIYKNLNIEKLYEKHLTDRINEKETIFKKRLSGNNLINYIIFKKDEYLEKLAQRGYILYTNYGYTFKPTFTLFKDANALYKNIYGKSVQKLKFFTIAIILILQIAILSAIEIKNFKKEYQNKSIVKQISNTKQELKNFYKTLNRYEGLTLKLNSQNSYTLQNALADLENYLQNSKINRHIGKPLENNFNNSLKCKIPNGLIALLKKHNGIEQIVPSRDLLSFDEVKKSINNNGNFAFTVARKDKKSALVFKCNKSGLFEYSGNRVGKKEFYDFKHFLKVIALAYKKGAFFDDLGIKVDMKKYAKIYKNSLSIADKQRYKSKINYLKNRAAVYKKYGNTKLKIALLKEIARTFDEELIKSVEPFLNDNKKVRVEAIETLGDIGNRKVIKKLLPFLSSKDKKSVDFTLIALSKIVNKNDANILKYIYPILNDDSILVKISAYRVIAKIASKDSLNIVKAKFKKESAPVKLEIIKTLAKIGTINELPLLSSYLSKVKNMDFSDKNIFRARGVTPHPLLIEAEIINTINKIYANSKFAQK